MMLLIDIGNTRVKLAWLGPSEVLCSTQPQSLDYADLARFVAQSPQVPDRILGSNVAGDVIAQALQAACLHHWNLPVQWCDARTGAQWLHNPYARPERLGSDRWLGMLGVLHRVRHQLDWQQGAPCVLASFGTATTVDTLVRADPATSEAEAQFLGGLILPGVTLMAHSLADGTARLPLAGGPCVEFPIDTHAAITSGIAAAQGGALLRQWRLAQRLNPRPPRLFVTGGGWPSVGPDICEALARAQADLHLPEQVPQWLDAPVLDGLACLGRHPG
ncbi:MAG TPA: type III pantothenate kinase [Castellaniella sp.]|uniref:type III pantothenate kinase n=1 Tax=Castellaniella sp. TaxID=1955812 RepID=UPI002F23516E